MKLQKLTLLLIVVVSQMQHKAFAEQDADDFDDEDGYDED